MKTIDILESQAGGGGSLNRKYACELYFWPQLQRKFKKYTTFFKSFLQKNDFYSLQKVKAFTLAEVLITLGIIGVVAAMTLPTLVNQTKNMQYKVGLQKAYSVLSQAIQKLNADQGYIVNRENYGKQTLAPALKKYLNVGKDCNNRDCQKNGTDEDVGNLLSAVYKTYNGNRGYNANFDEGQVILTDGMFIMIDNDGNNPICISVDVNGYKKKPNRFGFDVFMFQFDEKTGKMLPMGMKGTRYPYQNYCSTTSSYSQNGLGCTEKALTDENYFKNLPK